MRRNTLALLFGSVAVGVIGAYPRSAYGDTWAEVASGDSGGNPSGTGSVVFEDCADVTCAFYVNDWWMLDTVQWQGWKDTTNGHSVFYKLTEDHYLGMILQGANSPAFPQAGTYFSTHYDTSVADRVWGGGEYTSGECIAFMSNPPAIPAGAIASPCNSSPYNPSGHEYNSPIDEGYQDTSSGVGVPIYSPGIIDYYSVTSPSDLTHNNF